VGANRERMRAALARDPDLRAAAERAAAVHRALRERHAVPMPRGLRRRLLGIPAPRARRAPFWLVPAGALAGAAAVAIAVWLARESAPPPDERVAALAEFELAMQYLNKSARITQREVTGAVGNGLRNAWVASRQSIEKSTKDNGG
jgi:hypothetical protein